MIFFLVFILELMGLYLASMFLTRSIMDFLVKVLRNRTLVVAFYAVLFLPGTIIHELGHFFMAAILLVPVGEVRIFPEIDGDEVKLGTVAIARTDPFRRALIGVAPFTLGTAAIIGLSYYLASNNWGLDWWQIALGAYFIFQISNTMFASKRDLEGTAELAIAVVVIITILIFIGLIFGIQIEVDWEGYLLNSSIVELARRGSLILAIPLLINTGLLLLAKSRKILG